jgi:hypothetical protein
MQAPQSSTYERIGALPSLLLVQWAAAPAEAEVGQTQADGRTKRKLTSNFKL